MHSFVYCAAEISRPFRALDFFARNPGLQRHGEQKALSVSPPPLMQSVMQRFVARALRHHPGLVYIAPLGLVPVTGLAPALH